MNRVVIVSWGAVTPAGLDDMVLRVLREQNHTIKPVPDALNQAIPEALRIQAYAPVELDLASLISELGAKKIVYKKHTNPDDVIEAQRSVSDLLRRLERYHQLFFISSVLAGRDSDDNQLKLDDANLGIYLGSGIGGAKSYAAGTQRIANLRKPLPTYVPNSIPSIVNPVNCYYDTDRPTMVFSGACLYSSQQYTIPAFGKLVPIPEGFPSFTSAHNFASVMTKVVTVHPVKKIIKRRDNIFFIILPPRNLYNFLYNLSILLLYFQQMLTLVPFYTTL